MNKDFPDEVLDRIREFSHGAVLIYSDEKGNPSYIPLVRDQVTLNGLLVYAKNLGLAFESSQFQAIARFFNGEQL